MKLSLLSSLIQGTLESILLLRSAWLATADLLKVGDLPPVGPLVAVSRLLALTRLRASSRAWLRESSQRRPDAMLPAGREEEF